MELQGPLVAAVLLTSQLVKPREEVRGKVCSCCYCVLQL